MHRIKAAGALHFYFSRKAAYQPDVLNHISAATVFANQFCASCRLQRRCLDLVFQQFNSAGRKSLVKLKVSELKILYFYKHKGRSGKFSGSSFVGGTLGRSAADAS